MRTEQTARTRSNRQVQQRSRRGTSLLMMMAAGAIIITLVVLFPLEWVRVPAVTMAAEREAFSPNSDGNLDDIALVYGLSQDATVNVKVLNAAGQVMRTLVEEEMQATGQHSVLWDGRSDQGAIVPDGAYTVRVEAQGTVRTSSRNFGVVVDSTPPIIRLANLPDDVKVGKEELLIEGTTEPGSTLWLNDQPQPVTVGPDGSFSLRHLLREGDNRIELAAIDPSGNAGSVVRDVTLILRPPEILIDNPPEGVWINEPLLSVQGQTLPETRLTVNNKQVAVGDDGRFNVDILLEEGENIVRVEATDQVGNETSVERRVILKMQPPPISLASVQDGMEVHEPSLLVAGQTEVGATAWVNGQETTVDTQGGFQSVVNLVEGLNLVRVEVVDRAGNASRATSNVLYTAATGRPAGTTLRTALLAGFAGAALVFALWILLGGWYGPNALSLTSNQPFLSSNPYDGQDLRFSLELARPAQVMVQVWDTAGELVTTLMARRRRRAGFHTLEWDGTNSNGQVVPDGTYEIEATASTIFTTVSNRLSVFKTNEQISRLRARRVAEEQVDRGLELK